jgi:hypothetical protein
MDRRCKHCGEAKPLDEFYADAAARDGRRPECKACTAARRRRWYEANREREIARVKAWQQANAERHNENQRRRRERPEVKAKEREGHLRRKFNLTQEEYEQLLNGQSGGCAVCAREPKPGKSLHVDHDHETGEVHGLLCFSCNAALGHLGEDRERITALSIYLLEHDAEFVVAGEKARERLAALLS